MKEQRSTHLLDILLTVWVIAMAALTLTACGQQTAIAPSTAVDATANETTADANTETTVGTPCVLVEAPTMRIHYQDETLTCCATMTPSVHTYALGAQIAPGTRPCEQEQLCTIMLADAGGKVRLAFSATDADVDNAEFLAAANLTDLTLTAYPAAEDGTVDLTPEGAQSIPVAGGHFTLLAGRYYYELAVKRDNGTITYGLIANRIDAEKYEITWKQTTPCLVEGISEDPDVGRKSIPRFTIHRPFGHTGWNPWVLRVGGVGSLTYQNYAGTDVTILWDHGDPTKQFNIVTMDSTQLSFTYKIQYGVSDREKEQVKKTCYTRYAHDGTLLENEVEIPYHSIKLLENSYYVFTVTYENASIQYLLKTGSAEFTTHPSDDPALLPLTAALLRQSYHNYILPYSSPVTVDEIWIERYLGTFGGCQAVFIGGPFTYDPTPREVSVGEYTLTFESDQILYLGYKTRLYTVREAYEAKLISDRDVYDLGTALGGEAFLQRFPTPPAQDTGG